MMRNENLFERDTGEVYECIRMSILIVEKYLLPIHKLCHGKKRKL